METLAAPKFAELLRDENRILELIARGEPLRKTLDSLLRAVQTHSHGMLCSILSLDPDGIHIRHAAAPDLPESFISHVDGECIGPGAGSCGTAVFRREPVIVEDIATDPLWTGYREFALAHNLRACWSTPIFDEQGQVLGTFAMYFREPRGPDAWHLHLIDVATHIAAIAMSKERGEKELRRRESQLVEAQRITALGSYEWDIPNNRVCRSAELCQIFGLRPDEFEPTYEGYLARVCPDDRPTTKARIETAMREGRPFDFEERIVRPDGSIRVIHSRGAWTFDETQRPVKLVGTCQDITERKRSEEQLHAANAALADELEQRKRAEIEIEALTAQLIHAQEEERSRLARELHDDVGQQIAALSIATAKLKSEMGETIPDALAQNERIQQKIVQLGESIRRISHNLHPAVLEYSGLAAALRSYCWEFTTLTGIEIVFDEEGSSEHVNTAIALSLYRIAQEALQNVLKHAQVTQACVHLASSAECFRLAISDRGVGMLTGNSNRQGLGLLNIKQRVRALGGNMSIKSGPNQGTILSIVVPF